MIIDNGTLHRLLIPGVFTGEVGAVRGVVAFVPNSARIDPAKALVGTLDDQVVRLAPRKDAEGPFWTSTYEVIT